MQGHTVLFTSATNMLNDLAAQDGYNALRRRLAHYSKAKLLIIDEVAYYPTATVIRIYWLKSSTGAMKSTLRLLRQTGRLVNRVRCCLTLPAWYRSSTALCVTAKILPLKATLTA
jgi:hypothetical protein